MTGIKYVASVLFFLVWIFRLLVGAGSFYIVFGRLWRERFRFIKLVKIYLCGAIIEAAGSIPLVLMSNTVVLNWRFSITLFTIMFFTDLVRLPLIFYLLRGEESAMPNKEELNNIAKTNHK